MTTEIELLPLPVGEASSFGDYEVHTNETMVAYARANIARATAALHAEVEALRAEVDRLRDALAETRNRSSIGVMQSEETDLWRCTVCGRVGTVGRCCGEETRERVTMEQLLAENERLRAEMLRELERVQETGAEGASMNTINDGGPAFPVWELNGKDQPEMTGFGLSMRDWFAAKALQGLLANPGGAIQQNGMSGWGWCNCTVDDVAEFAWHIADAMLRTREASNEQ